MTDTTGVFPPLDGNEDWYTFLAIVLGTAYGVCSMMVCADVDGTDAVQLEVAMDSALLSTSDKEKVSKLRQIITGLHNALDVKVWDRRGKKGLGPPVRGARWVEWIEWLLSLFTGHPLPPHQRILGTSRPAIGYYANGIFAIMDVMLRPSLCPLAVNRFHVSYGQPLQIPVSETGYVIPQSSWRPTDMGILDPMSFPIASSLKSTKPDRKIRIDLEPCWEEDPRQVVFRARVDGVPVYTFSALRLIGKVGRDVMKLVT